MRRGRKTVTEIQYRHSPEDRGARYQIGTVPIGTIVYIQDDHRPLGGSMRALSMRPRRDCCKNPWIVEAWMNREYTAARRGPDGKWTSTIMLGGHLAQVRSLRDGRVRLVADWILLQCVDAGLEKSSMMYADQVCSMYQNGRTVADIAQALQLARNEVIEILEQYWLMG